MDWDLDIYAVDEKSMSHGQLMALVKHTKMKAQKGKGKGKGGKGAPKTCYECGVEGHIAADCSVRKERVAAGGPERLPSEDVQMGKVASLVAREKEASKAGMEKDQLENVEKEEKVNSHRRLSGRR